jgi:hypothetical protein
MRTASVQPLMISLFLALLCIFISSLNITSGERSFSNNRWNIVSSKFKNPSQSSLPDYEDLKQLGLLVKNSNSTLSGSVKATTPYQLFDSSSFRFSSEGVTFIRYFSNQLRNNKISLRLIIPQDENADVAAAHITALRATLRVSEKQKSYISIISGPIQKPMVILETFNAS